eukprot:GDKI01031893.1.p1 GENE.GDKI01031893.1~~GDKI01031893.1.p1  ORF type:complete len:131 (-),score=32.29 GDKI01031893.1:329-721(-)
MDSPCVSFPSSSQSLCNSPITKPLCPSVPFFGLLTESCPAVARHISMISVPEKQLSRQRSDSDVTTTTSTHCSHTTHTHTHPWAWLAHWCVYVCMYACVFVCASACAYDCACVCSLFVSVFVCEGMPACV